MLLLKHIEDNLFIVDTEEEIKTNDYFINCDGWWRHNGIIQPEETATKIIAQLKDQLSGVILFPLPEEKVNVEKLAYNECDGYGKEYSAFIRGYYRCLSDNKERKYTEQDIELAVILARKTPKISLPDIVKCCDRTQINLQQYDGKAVEIDVQCDGHCAEGECICDLTHTLQPRLTNGKITITKIL